MSSIETMARLAVKNKIKFYKSLTKEHPLNLCLENWRSACRVYENFMDTTAADYDYARRLSLGKSVDSASAELKEADKSYTGQFNEIIETYVKALQYEVAPVITLLELAGEPALPKTEKELAIEEKIKKYSKYLKIDVFNYEEIIAEMEVKKEETVKQEPVNPELQKKK